MTEPIPGWPTLACPPTIMREGPEAGRDLATQSGWRGLAAGTYDSGVAMFDRMIRPEINGVERGLAPLDARDPHIEANWTAVHRAGLR
jgi:hypothetical protein